MTTLATRAIASLAAYFDSRQHQPSAAHWAALRDIADTLERMALGQCDPKVFVSAVDPGVGKSQTVIHFARTLLADPAYRDVGMVICVGRIAEAQALAAQLGVAPDAFAVLTNNDDANSMGNPTPDRAQLLITTQQRIDHHCRRGSFESAAEFHYLGLPRQVRVWDEEWLPGAAVALNGDDLAGLFRPLRLRFPEMTGALEALRERLAQSSAGACIAVPDIEREYGVSIHDAIAAVATGRDDQLNALNGLFLLGGKLARVGREGALGNALIGYGDTLPSDLPPLLVLDASGRVRHTYVALQQHRRLVEPLKAATKDYSPLTVHVWQRAASMSAWQKHSTDLVDGIAKTIASKPDEDWLVICHKPGAGMPDVERKVTDRLPPAQAQRVNFLTWGKHRATNLYLDVPNVILASFLFMRPSYYTALTHMTHGKPATHDMRQEAIRQTQEGEYRNLLLQAICRGRVRRLNGDKCWPMDAYVVAAKAHGIPKLLHEVFPGCHVTDWQPQEVLLKGRLKAAVAFVKRQLADGVESFPLKAVGDALDIDRRNLRKLVTGRPEWQATMTRLGVAEVPHGRALWLHVGRHVEMDGGATSRRRL